MFFSLLQTQSESHRNEFFLPGRMAYVVDLEDNELIDNDVPTTLIRSKADCPDIEVNYLYYFLVDCLRLYYLPLWG